MRFTHRVVVSLLKYCVDRGIQYLAEYYIKELNKFKTYNAVVLKFYYCKTVKLGEGKIYRKEKLSHEIIIPEFMSIHEIEAVSKAWMKIDSWNFVDTELRRVKRNFGVK